ncbi:MAG: hypothetical protein OHK0029_01030 [Armatimonadaceae bacterium]
MAEVHVERKEGVSWWPWLLAALVVAGIIWWIVEANDRDVAETTPAYTTEQTYQNEGVAATQPATNVGDPELANPNMPFAAIAANPDAYFGKPISGMATVAEVDPSGEGFWIEQDGVRMFAVRDESLIYTEPLVEGQRVSLTGTVSNPSQIPAMAPTSENISAETMTDVRDEKAYLMVTNIEPQNELSTTYVR